MHTEYQNSVVMIKGFLKQRNFLPVITAVVLIVLLFPVLSCRTEGKRTIDPYVTYGWLDDNTFRILSSGSPDKKDTNIVKRKMTAKNSAVKNARIKLIEMFIPSGSGQGPATRIDEYYAGVNPEADSIMSVIMNGKVSSEMYDESWNCDIIYEISSPGLRKKLERGGME